MLYLNDETIKLLEAEEERRNKKEEVKFNVHPVVGQEMFKTFLDKFVVEFDITDEALDAIFSSVKIREFYRTYWCNTYVNRVWRSLMELRLVLEFFIDKGFILVRDYGTIVRHPIISFVNEDGTSEVRSIIDLLIDGDVDQNYRLIESLRKELDI
jgi:myosin-crossreactive antigen